MFTYRVTSVSLFTTFLSKVVNDSLTTHGPCQSNEEKRDDTCNSLSIRLLYFDYYRR